MKTLKEYTISIAKLEDKKYVHDFEGGDDFFAAFEQDLVEKGHFKAQVTLDKSATMIQMTFNILGTLSLVCDRSLEIFEESFTTTEKLILKFADHWEELTEEITLIPRDTPTVNIAQYLYEFISLTVPMKKLHPRFREEENEDNWEEEGTMVYSTATEEEGSETEEEPTIDPRWAALSKLKS